MGEAFRLVPELLARELTAIGYKLEGERLTLACAEPIDVGQQREISAFLEIEVAGCVLADPVAIEHLMNAVYPRLSSERLSCASRAGPSPPATRRGRAPRRTSSSSMIERCRRRSPSRQWPAHRFPTTCPSNGSLEPHL